MISQQRLELQAEAWQRLRGASVAYEQFGGDWAAAMLRDLLVFFDQQQDILEIALAVAAARAGLRIRTGRLSVEQRLFAEAGVRPLHSEEERRTLPVEG